MKTEIENIIYNYADEIPHIFIRVINAITLSDSKKELRSAINKIAKDREEAERKFLEDCGMVMGRGVHSTLPDEQINWAFDTHPEERIIETIEKS